MIGRAMSGEQLWLEQNAAADAEATGNLPLFPSDIDLAKNGGLGTLRQPEQSDFRGTLLAPSGPYYEGGFRILVRCPEFRLIQDFGPEGPIRVEWNHDIHRRFLKSTMRINSESSSGAETWKNRVALACALDSLRSFYDANKEGLDGLKHPERQHADEEFRCTPNGGLGCARVLGATLGAELSKALRADDPDQAIKDLTASFGVALRAVARSHAKIEDKRTGKRPKPHDVIRVATELFREFERRPIKEAIKLLLVEHYGFKMRGHNAGSAWEDLFNEAGLGNLPEVGREGARLILSDQEKG
jgi:hypothetical protein